MKPEGEARGRHYLTGESVSVHWAHGLITRVAPADSSPTADVWLAPALFDLQVNGFGGVDFQRDNLSIGDLLKAARALRAQGCGRFLLTLITDSWDRLTSRFRHLRALRSATPALRAAIAGWHIEGPFLSAEPGFCGTHNPAVMLDPKPEHIAELASIADGDPLLITMAPERPGALQAIALASSKGIRVSLGHTNARAEILREAVAAGACAFTHLGNGCAAELNRHDNILWRVLDQPELMATVIPDGIHVTPAPFRLFHRAIGERICYITDSMAAAGAKPGRYTLGPLKLQVGEDEIVRQPGTPYLSGSALRPVQGVIRAAKMLGQPWQQCWDRFSARPAALMALPGGLTEGAPAHLCLLRSTDEGSSLEILQCPNS